MILRLCAGVLGGYGLASLAATAMALALPIPPPEAVLAGTLLGLALYPVIIILAVSVTGRRLSAGVFGAMLLACGVVLASPGITAW